MNNTIRLASPLQFYSIVDGKGIRMVLWCQGCKVHCLGCHNPETQTLTGGKDYEIGDIITQMLNHKNHHQGITLSGGDPFLQPEQCKVIAEAAHNLGLDVWAYCGLTYEQIIRCPDKLELLKKCDVLVDGPFIESKKDLSLAFRGSSNQRIIDVQKSLSKRRIVLYENGR